MLAGNPAVQSVVNNVLQTNSKQNAKFAAAPTSTVAVQVYVISFSKVNNYRKKNIMKGSLIQNVNFIQFCSTFLTNTGMSDLYI